MKSKIVALLCLLACTAIMASVVLLPEDVSGDLEPSRSATPPSRSYPWTPPRTPSPPTTWRLSCWRRPCMRRPTSCAGMGTNSA